MTEVDMHLYSDDWHPITILTYVTHISVHQNVEFDQYKAVNVIPLAVSVYYSTHQHVYTRSFHQQSWWGRCTTTQ